MRAAHCKHGYGAPGRRGRRLQSGCFAVLCLTRPLQAPPAPALPKPEASQPAESSIRRIDRGALKRRLCDLLAASPDARDGWEKRRWTAVATQLQGSSEPVPDTSVKQLAAHLGNFAEEYDSALSSPPAEPPEPAPAPPEPAPRPARGPAAGPAPAPAEAADAEDADSSVGGKLLELLGFTAAQPSGPAQLKAYGSTRPPGRRSLPGAHPGQGGPPAAAPRLGAQPLQPAPRSQRPPPPGQGPPLPAPEAGAACSWEAELVAAYDQYRATHVADAPADAQLLVPYRRRRNAQSRPLSPAPGRDDGRGGGKARDGGGDDGGGGGGGGDGGGGAAAALAANKALKQQLAACEELGALGALIASHWARMDGVSLSTAWHRLAWLAPAPGREGAGAADAPQAAALAPALGLLVERMAAVAPRMGFWGLADCLSSMRRLGVQLAAHGPLGQQLAERVARRLAALAARGALADGPAAEHVWCCLSAPRARWIHPWSDELLALLVVATLPHLPAWEPGTAALTVKHLGKAKYRFRPHHKEAMAAALVAGVGAQAARGGGAELHGSLDHWLTGAALMRLQLPPATLKQLHDALLAMPEGAARELGVVKYNLNLKRLVDLGYQPSAAEAERWRARLLGPPGAWPQGLAAVPLHELIAALVSLSAVDALVPGEELLAAAQGCLARCRRWCSRPDARRLLLIDMRWPLVRSEAEVQRLKRLAGWG